MFEAGFCVADGVYSVVMVDATSKESAEAASKQHAEKYAYKLIYCKQITDAETAERRAKGMPVIKANDDILQMLDQLDDESKAKFCKFLISIMHSENHTTAPLSVLEARDRIKYFNMLDAMTPTATLYHDAIKEWIGKNEPTTAAVDMAFCLAWCAGMAEGKRLDRQRRRAHKS